MKIRAHKLGIAGALTVGAWYTFFAFFAKLWPTQTIYFLTSINLMKPLPILARYLNITMPSFLLGLVFHLLFGYISLRLLGIIYNTIQHKQ